VGSATLPLPEGLERLAAVVAEHAGDGAAVAGMSGGIISAMVAAPPEDDIALLGVRVD